MAWRIVLVAGVVGVAGVAQAGQWDCPPDFDGQPASSHSLEGTIGHSRVRVYLERGGAAVVGIYYYTRQGKPLVLEGAWGADGDVRLRESTVREGDETGAIEGRLSPAGLTGVWTSPDGARRLPVKLRSVPTPPCDGRGPWRRFEAPDWPVTFSYPASWLLRVDGDQLLVSCPDPAAMLSEPAGVTVRRGAGVESFDQGSFARCAGKWYVAAIDRCACDSLESCVLAAEKPRDGMVVVDTQTQWRGQCRLGGYTGLVDAKGALYLIDGGRRWATLAGAAGVEEVLARIGKSVRPRTRE
jgi:hypothetical protein